MASNDLRKLNRRELLEMLLEQTKELERVEAELADTKEKLNEKYISIERAGSIAEAAFSLHRIYDEVDAAAKQYLDNIQKRDAEAEAYCARLMEQTEEECSRMKDEAMQEHDRLIDEAKQTAEDIRKEADAHREETEKEINGYIQKINTRLRNYYHEHPDTKECLLLLPPADKT